MPKISHNPEFSDVLNDDFVQGAITVTTSEIEAKVGTERLNGREVLRIYNGSGKTVYFGPSGVTSATGEPLKKNRSVTISVGDKNPVFLVTNSGTANDVIVMELS